MDGRGDTDPARLSNFGPITITTPGDRQIVVARLFDAPRALVFEAWTKTEHVARWWDPSRVPLAVCEIDLRPGGAFRWLNRSPDGGEGHAFCGTYREISPACTACLRVQSSAVCDAGVHRRGEQNQADDDH